MSRGRSPPQRGRRVSSARGRSASSTRWLTRQLKDPYVAAAKRRGFRSRAAFKMIEIDDRFRLLAVGKRVVDLGAAPGGWTQVAVERVGAAEGRGAVVAVDVADLPPIPGATALKGDLREPTTISAVRRALRGPADVVLSDASPPTTGHAATDHLRIMALAEAALAAARTLLAPGGALVVKVFQGEDERALLAVLRRQFAKVRHVKPPASRPASAEVYVVATGFRGEPNASRP